MIQGILDSIVDWLKSILINCIMDNLNGMFDQINSEIGEVASNVGTTPASWNVGVFSMIRTLSDNVVVPIAGMILTVVLCYELITMIIDRNNLHDFETFIFYKWIVKAFAAVLLVTHTFDITMGIFDVAQHIVQQSAGIISGTTSVDFATALGNVVAQLETMGVGELLGLVVETLILRITAPVISICVMLVLVGRMIEIYIFCSVGAIPLATMANREWGQTGQNYLRGLAALGLQGFFIMLCVAIYAVLIGQIGSGSSIHASIWKCMGYTVAWAGKDPQLFCYTSPTHLLSRSHLEKQWDKLPGKFPLIVSMQATHGCGTVSDAKTTCVTGAGGKEAFPPSARQSDHIKGTSGNPSS